MKKWKTAISTHHEGKLYVRGVDLHKLVDNHTFTEVIYLLLKGRLPKKNEAKMLDAILVTCIEHGVEAPSAFVARTVASTGNPMNAALAAGALAIGEWHGGAIEAAARVFQDYPSMTEKEVVQHTISTRGKVPGYGHKVYKDVDPRAQHLFERAKKFKLGTKYINKALRIEKELEAQIGKHLPINIDGAIAAIMCELGLDWQLGKAVFILGRLPGLTAHIHEELLNEKPYRRLDSEDVEYTGPEIKKKK